MTRNFWEKKLNTGDVGFDKEKAEEFVKVGSFEWGWSELLEEKRKILLKKIEPDGDDYRLKREG